MAARKDDPKEERQYFPSPPGHRADLVEFVTDAGGAALLSPAHVVGIMGVETPEGMAPQSTVLLDGGHAVTVAMDMYGVMDRLQGGEDEDA